MASKTRRIAVDNHIYKPLIAFHLMKKSCGTFPDEKMIQLEYWDDKYIEPVFDFFSQNENLIPERITMIFKDCMPLLERDKKQKLFTSLSSSLFNSNKKRKLEKPCSSAIPAQIDSHPTFEEDDPDDPGLTI